LGRRLSLPARVQALVRAESLFNDGTSLVLFQIAVSLEVGSSPMTGARAWLGGVGEFAVLAGGGAAAGAVVAAGVIVVRRRITDPVLETVTALVTPYAAYLLGGMLHVSGVTAVIVAGVAVGAWRSRITTAQTRLQLHSVYQTVVFLLESVVFALIGLELPTLVRELGRGGRWPLAALAVTGTLIAIRVAWVFPVIAYSQWRRGERRPSWPVPIVVSWAGTRGVVPLAAALSIPLTTAAGRALPQRDLVLVLAATTIVISLIVQGFTLGPLAQLVGFRPAPAGARHEEILARLRMAEAGLARLEELAEAGAAPDEVIDRLRASLQARVESTRAHPDQAPSSAPKALTERELRADLITAESTELMRACIRTSSASLTPATAAVIRTRPPAAADTVPGSRPPCGGERRVERPRRPQRHRARSTCPIAAVLAIHR
jgi:monovalent cation/hydrogen antiporter